MAQLLEAAVRAAGLPVVGVSIGDPADRSTWRVDLAASATPAQRAQAVTVRDTVVVDGAALLDADAVGDVDQKVLRAVVQALWEAIPAPLLTKAQLRARAIAIYKTL